jgi:hypothetical protein
MVQKTRQRLRKIHIKFSLCSNNTQKS